MTEEFALIEPLLRSDRRPRWSGLLQTSKGRRKFINALSDFKDFEPRIFSQIPREGQSAESIESTMCRKGASGDSRCAILSENSALDGQQMSLHEALGAAVGTCMGTLIVCTECRLAYYEGELAGNRAVLAW